MGDLITILAEFGAAAYPVASPSEDREAALRAAATFAAGGLTASIEAWLRGALAVDRAALAAGWCGSCWRSARRCRPRAPPLLTDNAVFLIC